MRDRAVAAVLLVAANLFWAGSYVVAQTAVPLGAGRIAALRYLIGGLLSLPLWLRRPFPRMRAILFAALLGVLGNAIAFGLQMLGLQHSDATIAALSIAFEPLATALWARAILGERLGRFGPVAFLVGLVGVWMLAGSPRPGHAGDILGVGLLVAATVFYGLYGTLGKRLLEETDAWTVTGVGAMAAGIVLIPWLPLGPPVHWFSGSVVLPALYLGIFATLVGNGLFFWAIRRAEVSFSAFFLYLQPLAGAVLGWAILGEWLRPLQIWGGALLLVAVGLGGMASRGSADPQPESAQAH